MYMYTFQKMINSAFAGAVLFSVGVPANYIVHFFDSFHSSINLFFYPSILFFCEIFTLSKFNLIHLICVFQHNLDSAIAVVLHFWIHFVPITNEFVDKQALHFGTTLLHVGLSYGCGTLFF